MSEQLQALKGLMALIDIEGTHMMKTSPHMRNARQAVGPQGIPAYTASGDVKTDIQNAITAICDYYGWDCQHNKRYKAYIKAIGDCE